MTAQIPTEGSPLLELPVTDSKKGYARDFKQLETSAYVCSWTKDAIRTAALVAVFLFFGNIGEVFKTISR